MPFPTVNDQKFVRAAKQFPAASAGVAATASHRASLLSYTDISGELPEAQMPVNMTMREFVFFNTIGTATSSTVLNELVPDAKLGDVVHVFTKTTATATEWSVYARAVCTNVVGTTRTWTLTV